jgi:cell wall-associated NlpC family hydrolase
MGVSNAYERSLVGDQIAQATPRLEASNGAKMTPEDLIIAAEKHLGKPYKFGANGDTEIDCSQLIVEALKANRVVHSQFDTTAAGLALYARPKSPQDVERGDLVFLRQKGVIAHVAIALGPAKNGSIEIIDASSDAKKVDKRFQQITSSIEVGTPYFYT